MTGRPDIFCYSGPIPHSLQLRGPLGIRPFWDQSEDLQRILSELKTAFDKNRVEAEAQPFSPNAFWQNWLFWIRCDGIGKLLRNKNENAPEFFMVLRGLKFAVRYQIFFLCLGFHEYVFYLYFLVSTAWMNWIGERWIFKKVPQIVATPHSWTPPHHWPLRACWYLRIACKPLFLFLFLVQCWWQGGVFVVSYLQRSSLAGLDIVRLGVICTFEIPSCSFSLILFLFQCKLSLEDDTLSCKVCQKDIFIDPFSPLSYKQKWKIPGYFITSGEVLGLLLLAPLLAPGLASDVRNWVLKHLLFSDSKTFHCCRHTHTHFIFIF